MLQYDFNWGHEDLISAKITVTKGVYFDGKCYDDEIYLVKFFQTACNEDSLLKLRITDGNKVIHEKESMYVTSEGFATRTIEILVRAINNPRPERLFDIIDKNGDLYDD
jgi:hypothetical protein